MKETNTENRRLHEQIKKVTISAPNGGQKFIFVILDGTKTQNVIVFAN